MVIFLNDVIEKQISSVQSFLAQSAMFVEKKSTCR